jgi:hypothetical protein
MCLLRAHTNNWCLICPLQAFGLGPSYVAAGASAASYSLAVAIESAFESCRLTTSPQDVDKLLFDGNSIECVDEQGDPLTGITGYQLVMVSLVSTTGRDPVCSIFERDHHTLETMLTCLIAS